MRLRIVAEEKWNVDVLSQICERASVTGSSKKKIFGVGIVMEKKEKRWRGDVGDFSDFLLMVVIEKLNVENEFCNFEFKFFISWRKE